MIPKSVLSGSLRLILAVVCAGLTTVVRADVKLPGLFSDHMVLQQGTRVPIWGWADEGEKITVVFRGKKVAATARNGKWVVKLPSQKAGGPDTLTVEGKNKIQIRDVAVGEVWICSGQSNMEWPLRSSFESEKDIATSTNPNIHLFTAPKLKANSPVDDVKANWEKCDPDTVRNFSAVAYYFGRDLQKARGVPVGLIHTSWGGSPAEVWIREAVLGENPGYKHDILDGYDNQFKGYQAELARWEKETEASKKEDKPPARGKPSPPWKPAELFNGMIAPLIPYALKGAIWYQGESNASRAWQYRTLFPEMIRNWRQDWGQGDFTFLACNSRPGTGTRNVPWKPSPPVQTRANGPNCARRNCCPQGYCQRSAWQSSPMSATKTTFIQPGRNRWARDWHSWRAASPTVKGSNCRVRSTEACNSKVTKSL